MGPPEQELDDALRAAMQGVEGDVDPLKMASVVGNILASQHNAILRLAAEVDVLKAAG